MARSKLLAGLRATRMGAVVAAAALATTSVVAASAALPDQAADRAQEALDHAAQAPMDTDDDAGLDDTDLDDSDDLEDLEDGDDNGDNGRSAEVHDALTGGAFTPEDGDLFGQAVAEQAREQEQGSFGRAIADAARGDDVDENDDDENDDESGPPANLPEQAENRGGNANDARP